MNEDKPNYYFFWNGEFSQWYPSVFTVFGEEFNCAEQFMMAAKAKLFNDQDAYDKIMASDDPKTQKALGRKVKDFNAHMWSLVAKKYVTLGTYCKFDQHDRLNDMLYRHNDMYFVEASPYDKVWGVGMRANNPLITDSANWRGTNWLGDCINDAAMLLFGNEPKKQKTKVNDLISELNWGNK